MDARRDILFGAGTDIMIGTGKGFNFGKEVVGGRCGSNVSNCTTANLSWIKEYRNLYRLISHLLCVNCISRNRSRARQRVNVVPVEHLTDKGWLHLQSAPSHIPIMIASRGVALSAPFNPLLRSLLVQKSTCSTPISINFVQ